MRGTLAWVLGTLCLSATASHRAYQEDAGATTNQPHILIVVQDDLGFNDIGFTDTGSPSTPPEASANISALAREGLRLRQHYVHWHCAPTRRSLLTGRLPIHHGEALVPHDQDDIDLRWSWISDKLKAVGYKNYFWGKAHIGYRSMAHLPVNHGFDQFYGFMDGSGNYSTLARWNNTVPDHNNTKYSTELFSELTIDTIEAHDPSIPLFIYLSYQAVHGPLDLPPADGGGTCNTNKPEKNAPACANAIGLILADADAWIGRIVSTLKSKQMWDNTLILYTSDNGGVDDGNSASNGHTALIGGNNWPLRGEKHTNYNGGMLSPTFLTGGYLPAPVRGTSTNVTVHIADWYATFAVLAGADPRDDPPVVPLPVDPARPELDIYQGNLSYPPSDSVNVWPFLVDPTQASNWSAAHPDGVVLSAEVLVQGDRKLLVAQPEVSIMSASNLDVVTGWRQPNGTWLEDGGTDSDGPWGHTCNAFMNRTAFQPCLFDLYADMSEQVDIAPEEIALVQAMWASLNATVATSYISRSPPELLGPCNSSCALEYWAQYGGTGTEAAAPECGVPGCRDIAR